MTSKRIAQIGTVLALVFIGVILVRGAADLPTVNWTAGRLWVGLIGALILYVISQLVGATAWYGVLRIYDIALPLDRAASQLLASQIGKYIPGNVAHLFGRLSLARNDGVPTATAGAAMLLEVAALLTVGILLVGVLVLIDPVLIVRLTADLPETSAAVIVGAAILAIFGGLIVGQVILWRKAGRPMPTAPRLMLPIALHSLNFGVLGLSLWCVAGAIVPDAVPLWHCIAVFTTAWILGFLMPGAPGGIGVRDGIIALGLEMFIGQGAGLGVAVAHRFVSVLGDVVTFGIGLALRKTSRKT